jgi:hypothetical protein
MFRESFSDPSILSLVCSNHQYKIVPCSIVGVEEICYKAEEPKTASEDNELIFLSEFLKEFLLVFLEL